MLKRILISILLCPALLTAQSIVVGAHTGPPYTVDCSNSTTGTLSFTSTGTYNAGNVFRVEISDPTGAFPTYPLFVGTLALTGTNPSGTINLTIHAGLAAGAAYVLRISSSNPAVTSGSTAAFTINNASSPCSNGQLIVNEFSQGASGNKEYIELLVMGATPCSVVDIRHMIVDDNNGDYAQGGAQSGVGIADGHIRFNNSVYWQRVLSGTLILLYNGAAGEKNASITLADDPTDSNLDMVFVISVTAAGVTTGMEGTGTLPTFANAAYTPVVYGNTNWGQISLANGDDAVQTRTSAAAAMHGLSWGSPLIIAGPGVFLGTSSTSGKNVYNNSTSSWTNNVDFTIANVAAFETPGMANSANNMVLIGANTCTILPSELMDFTLTKTKNGEVKVTWLTENEYNVDEYWVERSANGIEFETILTVVAYNKTGQNSYQTTDYKPHKGMNYYRIITKDKNGDVKSSQLKSINMDMSMDANFVISENDDAFILTMSWSDQESILRIQNMNGQLISTQRIGRGEAILMVQKNLLPTGILVFSVIQQNQVYNFKKMNVR